MRFIVKRPESAEAEAARRQLTALPGLHVIADNLGRSFLVEAEAADVETLKRDLPDWHVFRERSIEPPQPPAPRKSWKD